MSNYNELKLTYEGGSQETITLTGNTIDYGEYQEQNIVAVEVPEIVQTIDRYAFCDNNSLANIVLNEGLERIKGQAFQHGVYTAVTIPSTVTEIGVNSFNTSEEQGRDQHTFTITCLATTPPTLDDWEGITFGLPELLQAIYVPAGSVSAYQEAWSNYATKIQALPTPTPTSGFSTLDIVSAYVGTEIVERLYLGDELVWGGEPGPDYSKMPLTFEILSAGTIVWRTSSSADTLTIQYSKDDGSTWASITSSTGGTNISVNAGDKVQFRGDNPKYYLGYQRDSNFSGTTAKFDVEGNIMSLIDSTGFATATTLASANTFNKLFFGCTGLTSAENLVLPATTLTRGCYSGMFDGCTSLTTAPALPATTLDESCYQVMFRNCTSLTTAPQLPATALANNCYGLMFFGCTSLTTAPALPATTLDGSCYQAMFWNCTSLTTAPELPATALTEYCYGSMFNGCTSLTTAPELPATTLAKSCYNSMFLGCSSLTSAPELPATTLANSCYNSMFNGCTNLNYIKCLATNISASDCTTYWVDGVFSHGTFVKNPNMSSWSRGDSGIPEGWTVKDADI